MLQPGNVIDRYTVDQILGSGGTAVVYLVTHSQLGTKHALKVLSITSRAIRERMLREGRVQATLRHLNVVAVTDVIDVEGNPGLVMEYVDGPSLDGALGKYRMDLATAETLFLGILGGVRAAHTAGLVHRDLKPANVLLYRDPQGFIPKVADFGLAKVLEGVDGGVGQTRQGIAMGTPSYMAPEQIRDAKTVDIRADVFSLGCILYELVTGDRAFPGDEALGIYNRVTGGEYRHPLDLSPDLPDRVVRAILGALVIDRDQRIPDCDTLRSVLAGAAWETAAEWVPERAPAAPMAREHSPPTATMRVAQGVAESPAELAGLGAAVVPTTTEAPVPKAQPLSIPETAVDGTLGGDEPLEWRSGQSVGWVVALAVAIVVLVLGSVVVGMAGLVLLGVTRYEVATPPPPAPVPETSMVEPAPPAAAETEAPEEKPGPETAVSPKPPAAPAAAPAPVKPAPREAVVPRVVPPAPRVVQTIPVKLKSRPFGASITVDGAPLKDRTPRKIPMTVGPHEVTLGQPGSGTVTFRIEVRPSGTSTWCVDFTKKAHFEGDCP